MESTRAYGRKYHEKIHGIHKKRDKRDHQTRWRRFKKA
nr:MAG TPA: hypothetical protein [Caudoviricetes sp.]